jgi:phosphoesterase RecJ-like protein
MIATIAQELRENERFLLATHVNPDGDAIGSLAALALVLKKMGKQVTAYCQDEVPGFLQFLPYSQLIVREIPRTEHFDLAVVLDCGELERIGSAVQSLRKAKRIIHIDHHSPGNNFGQLNLVKPESSSTAEILYDIFQAIPTALDVDVAENLYTAILTDTGSFRFANTTEKALVIAAEMVALGVVPEKVASAVYHSMSPERLKLLVLSLNTLTLRCEGRLAAIWVSREMFEETGTSSMETEGFVNYPRALNSTEMALFFKEMRSGEVNVSLRSRGTQNVANFARFYGGGGHQDAAAFRCEGLLSQVIETVLTAAEGFIAGGER